LEFVVAKILDRHATLQFEKCQVQPSWERPAVTTRAPSFALPRLNPALMSAHEHPRVFTPQGAQCMFMAPSAPHGPFPSGLLASEPPGRPPSPWLAVHAAGDPQRGEVEDFIRAVYARRYGATVPSFAPVLVALRDRTGIVAAAGYRSAAAEPLFLERYLEEPLESLLASHPRAPAQRHHIVEVGHLSARKPGEGRRLILLLGPHLAEQGFQWVASTITEELRHLLDRLGLAPMVLGAADPRALGEQASLWGSYYEHRPIVAGGYLPHALRHIRRHLSRPRTALHAHVA
jgi:hypothetical protein